MLRRVIERWPLLGNLRIGQLLYGAVVALVAVDLIEHYRGVAELTPLGHLGRWFGLVALTLLFGIYLQNTYRFGLVPDYSKLCRYCNGPVNRYSEFCEHCGADLIAEEKLVPCPSCGVDLYEGTKHCPECGAAIKPKGSKRAQKQKAKSAPPPPPDTREVGWSTPVDAVSGFPPDDERR